jgi:hypothetical protein
MARMARMGRTGVLLRTSHVSRAARFWSATVLWRFSLAVDEGQPVAAIPKRQRTGARKDAMRACLKNSSSRRESAQRFSIRAENVEPTHVGCYGAWISKTRSDRRGAWAGARQLAGRVSGRTVQLEGIIDFGGLAWPPTRCGSDTARCFSLESPHPVFRSPFVVRDGHDVNLGVQVDVIDKERESRNGALLNDEWEPGHRLPLPQARGIPIHRTTPSARPCAGVPPAAAPPPCPSRSG